MINFSKIFIELILLASSVSSSVVYVVDDILSFPELKQLSRLRSGKYFQTLLEERRLPWSGFKRYCQSHFTNTMKLTKKIINTHGRLIKNFYLA